MVAEESRVAIGGKGGVSGASGAANGTPRVESLRGVTASARIHAALRE